MRHQPDHSHPCQHCHVQTDCDGDLEQNYDGWPEVICVQFDTQNHADFLCVECRKAEDGPMDSDLSPSGDG